MINSTFKESPSGVILTLVSGAFSFLLLFYMIAKSPHQLRYDETYHLDLVKSIKTKGLYNSLLDTNNQSAAGPLYAGIQLALKNVTQEKPPGIRWVNGVLLATGIGILALIKPQAKSQTAAISCAALAVVGVPFLWPSAGMALTEIPAFTFFCAFLFCFRQIFPSSNLRFTISTIFAASAGAFLGLAILGRQTYLTVFPGLFFLFFLRSVRPWLIVVTVVSALLVSTWLFWIWGGLVPPSQAKVNQGLQWKHGLFSLAYVVAATAIFSPRWLVPEKKWFLIPAGLLGACLAVLTREYEEPPGKSLLIRLLGTDVALVVGFLVFVVMAAFGLNWLFITCMRIWQRRDDAYQVFCGITLLALVAAPVKISHLFSSRYVVGLLGVLLIILQPTSSKLLAARIFAGSLIGAAILHFYYYP